MGIEKIFSFGELAGRKGEAMRIKERMLRQFGNPKGTVGKLVGWVMAVSNRSLSDWTIEKLNTKGSESILEVGYGPGVTFQRVASKINGGLLVGIDHSELMFRFASRRSKKYHGRKNVILEHGAINEKIYPQRFFNTIYGNNVHFFWNDPVEEFAKLRSYLKTDGKLLMVFQPRWAKDLSEVEKIAEQTRTQFLEAGFVNIAIDFKHMKPITAIAVTGYNSLGFRF